MDILIIAALWLVGAVGMMTVFYLADNELRYSTALFSLIAAPLGLIVGPAYLLTAFVGNLRIEDKVILQRKRPDV